MTPSNLNDATPDATQLFVENFHNIRYEDLPPEVVRITKDQVLDFFGVALGGSCEAGVSELRDLVLEWVVLLKAASCGGETRFLRPMRRR
jgi:2-methylcitrate dehydratase PrpD